LRRLALRLAVLAVAVGAALAVLLATSSVPRARLVDGYVLFVGGLVALGLVRATRAAGGSDDPSRYELALRRGRRTVFRPRELERLEREVALAASSAFYLHFRLRPVLREIAAHRLESRRGSNLDDSSAETREALGEEVWEIVRPGRRPPEDRLAPGLSLERVRAALDTLERI
jgi:hypothetical protein